MNLLLVLISGIFIILTLIRILFYDIVKVKYATYFIDPASPFGIVMSAFCLLICMVEFTKAMNDVAIEYVRGVQIPIIIKVCELYQTDTNCYLDLIRDLSRGGPVPADFIERTTSFCEIHIHFLQELQTFNLPMIPDELSSADPYLVNVSQAIRDTYLESYNALRYRKNMEPERVELLQKSLAILYDTHFSLMQLNRCISGLDAPLPQAIEFIEPILNERATEDTMENVELQTVYYDVFLWLTRGILIGLAIWNYMRVR